MDAAASGKRRSFSQRVGTGGELAFRNFAHRQGLLGTKVEDDFGIDFMCQVDLDHLSRKASDIAGTVIGACVRATSSDDGKVFIYQSDAANFLNSGTPLVFVLAHVTSDPAIAPIYHRVVNEEFIHELHDFIESGANRLDVVPSDCLPEGEFAHSLAEMVSFGYSETVRVAVAAVRVNSVLPNTTVEVRTRADGRLTLVSTVDYFSLFARLDEHQERELLHAAFGADEYVADRVAELSLRPEVTGYLRSMPQPLVFAGFSREEEAKLRIVNGEHSATEPFTYRAIGTHFGYVHSAGISLIVSQARSRDGVMVHETEVFVDPLTTNVMEDLGNAVDFFALGSQGAKLVPDDRESKPGAGFDVDSMFTPMHAAAAMTKAWLTCSQLEGWPARSLELKHFGDAEIFNTVAGFAHLFDDPEFLGKLSFVLREVPENVTAADLERHPTTIHLPIIGNLADRTLVLRLTCDGSALLSDGAVVGFALAAITSASCEARDRVQKSTIYPEIVAGVTAPTLALGVAEQGAIPEGLGDVQLAWEDWDDPGGD